MVENSTNNTATPHPIPSRQGLSLIACGFALAISIQIPLLLMLLPQHGAFPSLESLPPWLANLAPSAADHPWTPLSIALLSSFLITLLFARHVVQPIEQLTAMTHSLTGQRYSLAPSHFKTPAVGALSVACNELLESLKQQQRDHENLAYVDPMTGLHNRAFFVKEIDHILQGDFEGLVVVVWDIDRFKSLNNVLGFAAGDHLLRALGMRFKASMKGARVLARLSSNTFIAAFSNEASQPAGDYAEMVISAMAEPVRIYGQPLDLSATCGIACAPMDGSSAADLMRRAEIAQSIARHSRLRWLAFKNHFEIQSTSRLTMLSELRAALQCRGQLQLYLQPKLNMSTGTIEQAEALVRWQHPQRGLIYPGEFIPFAEQTGRIHEITLWAIEEALLLIQSVAEIKDTRISVNVSALDLHQPQFAEKVIALLHNSKVDPSLLCLEITESNAMEDPDRVLETLNRLHEHRIYLAIDDFGSGYSSLAYMKRFPVDELKIDRTLVTGARRHTDSETILRCTIELGHHMGMLVTAEGVETIEEYGVLQHLAVDHIQGFLVSKAIPLEQYKLFCQAFNKRQLQSALTTFSMTPIDPVVVVGH